MEHRKDARRPTDPRAILGDQLYGGRCLAEQRPINYALMLIRDRPQLGGQGEGEQIVITGQQALLNALEPPLRPIGLALWAMATPTGVIPVLERATLVTTIEGTAEGSSATLDDVIQRPALGRQELTGVCGDIRRSCGANDVRQFEHERRERQRATWSASTR
jgi:hypothetical protein